MTSDMNQAPPANDEVQEQIISRLAEGDLLTRICDEKGMPNRSAVQRWRRMDKDFDESVWEAQAAGLMVQRDLAYQILQDAANNPSQGSAMKAQAAREMLHDIRSWASKLVSRMVERQHVHSTGIPQVITIRWADEMPVNCAEGSFKIAPSPPGGGLAGGVGPLPMAHIS